MTYSRTPSSAGESRSGHNSGRRTRDPKHIFAAASQKGMDFDLPGLLNLAQAGQDLDRRKKVPAEASMWGYYNRK